MDGTLQIKNPFQKHFLYWRILGLIPTEKYRGLYRVYSIFVNVFVTIGYPLHLMLGLLKSSTLNDIIQIVAINLPCIVCSMKTIFIWIKFENVKIIMEILRKQNQRISLCEDEMFYYRNTILKNLHYVFNMFVMLYGPTLIFSEAAVLINGFMGGNWTLMFPAYFPFDIYGSTLNYSVAHLYQYLGVTFQTLQGFTNDTFHSMQLTLLSGQIHTLGLRVTKLATNRNKLKAENNRKLLKCIQDHKDLLRYRLNLEDIISIYMFFQILITSINMCTSIVFLLLFADDPFTLIYYFNYFLAIALQIFPICYYGSEVELKFQNLTYALFSSNWFDQDEKFKRNLTIFAEVTKKPLHITALMFQINLNLFMAVCKNSYSLFALIMNMK
ncbi:odorant receptor 33b-like [Cochliomyia hominivorax]